jgi:electron transfer flavoprotein alpha subunit
MTHALIVVEPGYDPAPLVELARGVSQSVAVLTLATTGESLRIESDAEVLLGVVAKGIELAEVAADAIVEVVQSQGATLVVLPTSARFREVFPLLAFRLRAASVSDVLALRHVDGQLEADRLLYGGVAIVTVGLQRPVAVVTAPVGRCDVDAGKPVTLMDVTAMAKPAKEVVSRRTVERQNALPTAQRLVSFGRGVRNRDDMALIDQLAKLLSAEVGCSRPIVEDMRWLTVDHQVGLTGTTVAPSLYLAVGISGQIQHLVGMRESKVIVAINNNPAAPIFAVADIGIVGDLYDVVPRLIEALAAKSG